VEPSVKAASLAHLTPEIDPQSLTDRKAIRDTAPKNYDELFVQSQFFRL
jgi:hypothetical protein